MAINKFSPVPLYYQLQEILHDKLEDGVWEPGDRLPTEEELCEAYSVSRTTVRNALRLLKMEGLIEQARGKGTMVARPKVREYMLKSIIGSYALEYPRNGRVATKVLEKAIISPPDYILSELQLEKSQKVTKIERIRIVDKEPLFWTTAFVPYDICPGFVDEDFERNSFFNILENKHGIEVAHSTRTIIMILATSRAVEYLGVERASPLFKVVVVSSLRNGTPVEYSESIFRADRVKFEVTITREINSVQE